jgi:trk system potassium uptake protein TrkA
LAVMTAELLVDRGHEVVVIEADRARVDELSDRLDCSFLHGDGSRPQVLREVGPEQTAVLFCLTNNDESNILAALVGRSLGFAKVVPSIADPELSNVCHELGLDHTIVPDQTIGRYLADFAQGLDILELTTIIRGEARFYSFVASKDETGAIEDLALPKDARAVCLYRQGEFVLTDEKSKIQEGDELVILTHSRHLAELEKRWEPENSETE